MDVRPHGLPDVLGELPAVTGTFLWRPLSSAVDYGLAVERLRAL
ncbi:hypothetical protein RRSWK_04989 [Rhodopirellula sp. SWK7]|nr:hypothetical protein RRSWK_04989 [Rhodopirellula sp. SWK7]